LKLTRNCPLSRSKCHDNGDADDEEYVEEEDTDKDSDRDDIIP